MDDRSPARLRIRVEGVVQGVGFRPFVHRLAARHGLAGFVGNDHAGVFAEAEGAPPALRAFLADIERRAPPLAAVHRLDATPMDPRGEPGFRIVSSEAGAPMAALVAPDTATCGDCLAEITDPACRRHRYAFTNCTGCGPRYTIIERLPYDRCHTTMAGFGLCRDCGAEFADPGDRRFHAQPVCCPACGPALELRGSDGRPVPGDPIAVAARWLSDGRILAIKGLGGYHLAVRADHERAVATLRRRKHRAAKPFAVMAGDLTAARALVHMEPGAERALSGPRRPIVLLRRRADAALAAAVAPGNDDLGVMLPYTPLHHLLAAELGHPAVLTSGNVADEPIVHRDDDARERLAAIADGFLLHDRAIHARADDSVVRMFRGAELAIRRSRGYAPEPLTVRPAFRRPVLACGAELKNTFCLAKGSRAFLSPHVGDLESYATLRSFTRGVEHLSRLLGIRPALLAHDLHPEYLSTKYARERGGEVDLLGVQHHHAHIASCLADNRATEPVIGVAFDGTGFGPDATLWGGEILVADPAGYRRAGHLETVRLPGGAAAIREPWRMAAAYLDAIHGDAVPELPVAGRHRDRWAAVVALARGGPNSPPTSSAGRLFDAAAAVAGVRDTAGYEGQAAVEFEQRVDGGERSGYPVRLSPGPPLVIAGSDLIRCVADDTAAGVDVGRIAARFHNGLAAAVVAAVRVVRERTGLGTAALSGGVFQNLVLLDRVVSGLEAEGMRVLTHSRVPPGDGGIALGQAVIAGAADRGDISAVTAFTGIGAGGGAADTDVGAAADAATGTDAATGSGTAAGAGMGAGVGTAHPGVSRSAAADPRPAHR